jgi:hypothetical protein
LSHNSSPFCSGYFRDGNFTNYFPGLAWKCDPPDLCLTNSQDYRCEPPVSCIKEVSVSNLKTLSEKIRCSPKQPFGEGPDCSVLPAILCK